MEEKNTKLIADGGSTKIDWLLLAGEKPTNRFSTKGINPSISDPEEIVSLLESCLPPALGSIPIAAVEFYGAGCRGVAAQRMKQALAAVLKVDNILVDSDLYGAAKVLCGDGQGIVCILGTGSNSCLYDRGTIIGSVPPLGYILGDEGSGAVMGRNLIANIYKGQFSEEIRQAFFREYPYTQDEIIEAVYRKPQPNRFLAAFTYFISKNIQRPEIQDFVEGEFDRFFVRNVRQYAHPDWPVFCVGSIAEVFCDPLQRIARKHGYRIREIWKRPLDKLLAK